MAPEPTWQGIPIEIKEYFIGYLDYKTRCRLRVCSKSDRDFVDACPIALRAIKLDLTLKVLEIVKGGEQVEIRENIADNFCKLFGHKDVTVEGVLLLWRFRDSVDDIKEKLFAKLDELPKIKAKDVSILTYQTSDQEYRQIFQMFDPKHMKAIDINPKISQEEVDYLVGTDGWKNAKSIKFNGPRDIRIDDVLHTDYFQTSLRKFTAVDAWKLINSIINKENLQLQGHGFCIEYQPDLTIEQIVSEFKVAPRKVKNPKHETNPMESEYKYIFRTKTDGLFLAVEMKKTRYKSQKIEGHIYGESDEMTE